MTKKTDVRNERKRTTKTTQNQGVKGSNNTTQDLIPLIDYCDMMTTDEVCEFLKVSKDTIYKWIESGLIPHYRITDKKRLFNRKHICQWLNEKMVG